MAGHLSAAGVPQLRIHSETQHRMGPDEPVKQVEQNDRKADRRGRGADCSRPKDTAWTRKEWSGGTL